MKFSRMPPRPLETFHSVDEKRPRITFTKYIRGILNVFVGRLLDPFSFSFFFSSSSFPWNTILWLVFRKKKKGVSNPLSLPRRTSEGADQKGRARRSNGREKKMKKGRQEVCFFPRCVKRIPRRLTNPELAVSGKGVNVAADSQIWGTERADGRDSTKFLTSRHPSLYTRQLTTSTPAVSARLHELFYVSYVSSHDSSSDDPSYGYSSRRGTMHQIIVHVYRISRVWKVFNSFERDTTRNETKNRWIENLKFREFYLIRGEIREISRWRKIGRSVRSIKKSK